MREGLLLAVATTGSLHAQNVTEPDVHDPVAIHEGNYEYVFATGQGIGVATARTLNHKDYIFFHGYDRKYNGASKLLIREIKWDKNGWPVIKL